MPKWSALLRRWRRADITGFVAIEGLDGVGKSTVVKRLAELFSGYAMSTPGPALQDGRQAILRAFSHDQLARALFYAASVSSEGQKARSLADGGTWVFMDRYWASTLAYAKARGVTADLDALSRSFIQPDLTILLLLDESKRQKRLLVRGANAEDIETLEPEFRAGVLDELRVHADVVVNITGLDAGAVAARLSHSIKQFLLG